jgi:hypothetical protein
MDPKIEETINFVHSYAPDINDWKILKKELLKSLPPSHRKLFSTRDNATKKMNFNDFEKTVFEHWQKLTGIKLYLEQP